MEKEEDINDFRLYWSQPSLAAQLSEEKRKRITEKFFDLLTKSKEENPKNAKK